MTPPGAQGLSQPAGPAIRNKARSSPDAALAAPRADLAQTMTEQNRRSRSAASAHIPRSPLR